MRIGEIWRAATVPSLTFGLLFSSTTSAQEKNERWLAMAFVAEYRATPVYTEGAIGVFARKYPGRFYSQQNQLVGTAIGVDLRKNIFQHRIEGMVGMRLKYGHLLYESNPLGGLDKSINTWTTDYLFSLNGRIPVGGKREVRVGIGVGLMNRGSDYRLSEVDTLPNGSTIIFSMTGNFHYTSNIISLSYNVNGLECGITGYFSGSEPGDYDNPSPFWLPTFFLKYDIWK